MVETADNGRMPIQDLAPALLSISGAFQEMQRIKFSNQPKISLDVRSTKKGSFIVDLILTNGPDIFTKVIDFLTSKDTTALSNLIELTSFFGMMCKIVKSKSKSEVKLKDGRTQINLDNNETVIVDDDDIKILRSVEFRTQMERSVAPLAKEGVDSIEISSEKTETITISKNEIKQFELPEIKDETMEPIISEIYLQILNVAFEHGKWKFTDGSRPFFATIEDEAFMDAVSTGKQHFSTNDRLKVRLRIVQKATAEELKSEYFIEKVIEHVPGGVQLEFDI